MINDITKDARDRMGKTVVSFDTDLKKLRTGRAHTSLLDHITVEYYGSQVPLSQVANVAVEDSRTLTISPWEKPMVAVIEKAIMSSDLGLNPATAGTLIRVVRGEAEGARVAIRNIRRDAIGQIKELMKEQMISEDQEHKGEDDVQKLTDEFVAKIDTVLADKEKELLEV